MSGERQATPAYDEWESLLAAGTFEEVYEALESVVAHLEDARLPLADSLACYELGMRLTARCDDYLREAELRITRLDEAASQAAWDEDAVSGDLDE